MRSSSRRRALWATLVALALPGLETSGEDLRGASGREAARKVLAADTVGKVRREIYREGEPAGNLSPPSAAAEAPTVGFIDSPSPTCVQPDPRKDECRVSWGDTTVSADAGSYMTDMWFVLNGRVTSRVRGFFQADIVIPSSLHARGYRVPCGAPVDDTSSCTAPCTPLKVGTSYPWAVRARESTGLRAANYGTVTCPAFVGAQFYTLPPCRVLDTRNPAGPLGGPALQPGASRAFAVSAAACGIPSGAVAVSVNATVTAPSAAGYLTLFPDVVQNVSTINFGAGKTKANNAIVPLAFDFSGKLGVFNGSAGTVHFILDVNGYFK